MFTQRVPPFVLRILALTSMALAIPALVFAYHVFSRGREHYLAGTIAACLIGSILLTAAYFAFKQAGRNFDAHDFVASHRLLRAAAFVIALPALFGGSQFLWTSAILLNQEYLQWFPTTSWWSFGDRSILSVLLTSYVSGTILTYVGLFLVCFALFGRVLENVTPRPRDRG